jgi:MFS family permease
MNFLHIPKGIRLISWATAVRFAGWGFIEVFVPVFLLSFAGNFAETGLLKSVYDVTFLLSLPIISRLADRVSSKKIILSGLVLYPAIALCYYAAGVYGAIGFVIFARLLNGVSYALDSVGKKTYMRRHAHHHVGMMFGYFDTLSNFWWLAAGVAGLFLMKAFALHELFLLIIPTTLVAIALIARIPKEPGTKQGISNNMFKDVILDYRETISFIRAWSIEQKYTAFLYAFLGVVFVSISFFVPLASFAESHDYATVFLLTAFAVLPFLLGVPVGLLADRANKRTLAIALVVAFLFLALIPFVSVLWVKLASVFIVGISIYYSTLVLERIATEHERRSRMGSLSGVFLSVYQFAQVVSPLVIGLLVDAYSLAWALVAVAVIGGSLLVPLLRTKFFQF